MAPGDEMRGETRKRVYDTVRRYPGVHLRGIDKQTGISSPLASYHLKKLEADGWVESREQGGYLRFYPTSKGKSARVTEEDMPVLGLLRESTPLHIVLILLDKGPQTHADIVAQTGDAKSTVSYHLAKLAEAGVVEREASGSRLVLTDRERVYRLLLAYTPTPDLVDSFADLWDDLYG